MATDHAPAPPGTPLRVAVLDMQPIDPPVGGGRLRLLGLYHRLGFPVTYVGSYDWRGERYRRHRLSPSLEEIDVPLSERHFATHDRWQEFSNGHTIIDAAFPLMAHQSDAFVRAAQTTALDADAVIFSHPWVYPLVRDVLDDRRQLIVYDSQNVEGLLRAERMDDRGFGTELVKHVVSTEFELAHRADLILACSREDADLFGSIYGVPADRLREIPNGVFSETLTPPTAEEKRAAARALDLQSPCALFLGSAYAPNIEAAQYIAEQLTTELPEVTFVICGGVGDAIELAALRRTTSARVRFTGSVTEADKQQYLRAADVAINPMFSGSGTNIKMFDFGAAGVPVVTTPVGARGIGESGSEAQDWALIVEPNQFAEAVRESLRNRAAAAQRTRGFRQLVDARYAWERISPALGAVISEALTHKRGRNAAGHLAAAQLTSPQTSQEAAAATVVTAVGDGEAYQTGLLTTWGVRCGIAEYARHLVEALSVKGLASHVMARDDTSDDPEEVPGVASVERLWRSHEVDPAAIVVACTRRGLDQLSIQYHRAFFEEDALVDVALRARQAGLAVNVTLHNSSDMLMATLRALNALGVSLLVHDEDERGRLARCGLRRVVHVPMGVPEIAGEAIDVARNREGIAGAPVIGTFGFLRPHKGVVELIDAIAILRDLFPSIQLLALNALYPLAESEEYRRKCEQRIRDHDLTGQVHLRTEFVADVDRAIAALHACDLIVLPYLKSEEGSSAAAATALAARRPTMTTREPIFRAIRSATYPVESAQPNVLAAGIATVLTSPVLCRALAQRAEAYVQEHSWAAIATRHRALAVSRDA